MEKRYKTFKNLVENIDDLVFKIEGFEFLLYDVKPSANRTDGIIFKYKAYNEEDVPFSGQCLKEKLWAESYKFFLRYLNTELSYFDGIEIYDKGEQILNEKNEEYVYIPEYLVDEILSSINKTFNDTVDLKVYSGYNAKLIHNVDIRTKLMGCTIESDGSYEIAVLIDLKLLNASQTTINDVMDEIMEKEYDFHYEVTSYVEANEQIILDIYSKYKMLNCCNIRIYTKYHT